MTKSTGKCKVCGAACNPDAGIKVPVGWFCGYAHLFEYQREKTAKARERQAAKAVRKRKEDVKPIGYWRDKAQHAFNAFIRERDRDLGCVSCDKPADWNGQWHASHWKSVGARPDLRFNPDNCQKACSQCNLWLSGNPIPFKDELVRRIGFERVEALEGPHEPKRYRREDYQAIEAEYKAKLKELKQQVEGRDMRGYRIQGFNRKTGEFTVAQVAGYDLQQAMQLMGVTHYRLLAVDKIGVEL